MSIKVESCIFKREKDGPYETGLAVVKDFGVHDIHYIIDQNNEPVYECPWTYKLDPYKGGFLEVEPYE